MLHLSEQTENTHQKNPTKTQRTTHKTPHLAGCPQHRERLQPLTLPVQLPQEDPGREDYEDTIICTHPMDYREERLFLNTLRWVDAQPAPSQHLWAESSPGARDPPPSRNPNLPHFVLALKTHLRTHRLLAQVKSSSRCTHCQELPAASARQEGSKVQETRGTRLTDSAPVLNRAPFVPDLPDSKIRRGELMHTSLPCDCSPPHYVNTKIKARLRSSTQRPAPLQVHAPPFPMKPSPIKTVNFEEDL